MSERKLPETSIEAYKQSDELSVAHKKKILEALEGAEYLNYEQIADITGIDRHGVGRRLSELIKDGKIYRTEIKKPTRSKRGAFCHALIGRGIPKAEEPKPKKATPPKQTKAITEVPEDKTLVGQYLRTKPNANKFKTENKPKLVQQKLL